MFVDYVAAVAADAADAEVGVVVVAAVTDDIVDALLMKVFIGCVAAAVVVVT